MTSRLLCGGAFGLTLLLAGRSVAAQECPPPTPGSFSHITEVPYGDPPGVANFNTLYGNFLTPDESSDQCDPEIFFAGAPDDYYCADRCRESDACLIVNKCPSIAGERVSVEMADPLGPDWYRTGLPTPDADTWYNCLAYAVGLQDRWLWNQCEPDPEGEGWITIPQAHAILSELLDPRRRDPVFLPPFIQLLPRVRSPQARGPWCLGPCIR